MKAAKARLETRSAARSTATGQRGLIARGRICPWPKSSTPRKKVKDSQNSTPRKKSAPQVVLLDGRTRRDRSPPRTSGPCLAVGPRSSTAATRRATSATRSRRCSRCRRRSRGRRRRGRFSPSLAGRAPASPASTRTASTRKVKEARAATLDDAGIMARALADAEAYNKRSRDEFDRLMVISERSRSSSRRRPSSRALAVPGLVEEEELGAHHPQVLKANKLAQLKAQLAAADQDTHDAEEHTHTLQYMLNCQRDAHAVERGRLGDLREGREVDAQHAVAKLLHGKAVLRDDERARAAAEGARTVEGNVVYYDDLLAKSAATPARRPASAEAAAARAPAARRRMPPPPPLPPSARESGGRRRRRNCVGSYRRQDVVPGAAAGARPARRAGEPVRGGVSEDGARGGVVGSGRGDHVLTRNEVRAIPRRARRRAHAARRPRDRRLREKRATSRLARPRPRPTARSVCWSRSSTRAADASRSSRTRSRAAPAAGRGLRRRWPRPPPHRARADEVGRAARAPRRRPPPPKRASRASTRRRRRRAHRPRGSRLEFDGVGAAPMDHQLEVPETPPPAPTLPPEHPYQRAARAPRRESPQLLPVSPATPPSSTGSAAAAASRRGGLPSAPNPSTPHTSLLSHYPSRLARK